MPRTPELEWYAPVAELIAREGCTLAEAATKLRVPMTKEEAAVTFRSKTFQRLLRAERLRYYAEVGRDPEWSKKTAVGQLLHCIQELMTSGEFDKAAEVILKAAKIEGWLNPDTSITIGMGLSSKDIQDLRAKLSLKQPVDDPTRTN